jgi:D-aspartate ligase
MMYSKNMQCRAVQATRTGPGGPNRVVLFGSLNVLRCFGAAGIPVMVVDSDAESLTLRSRYARAKQVIACPREEPNKAVEDLVSVGKAFAERPMLAFDSDAMLLLVSRNREALGRYYRFLLPDPDMVEDLVGKLRFAALAERLNWPAPRSIVASPDVTAEDIVRRIGLPCVLKPNSHIGRFLSQVLQHERDRPHKVLRVDTVEELRRAYSRMQGYCDSFIVQEYVPGGDDSLYSFHACFDGNSRPLACFVGRKIRTYPKNTGFSTCLELVREPEVVRLGIEMMQGIKFVGPMKIDFKKDETRNCFLALECNPRMNLWMYLGTACGINLPAMALADLAGQPVTPLMQYRTGVKWLSFGDDARAFLREYRPAGDCTWAQWLWSLRGRKVHDVFAWRDPWPWSVCAMRYVDTNWRKLGRRFAGRGALTVGESGAIS